MRTSVTRIACVAAVLAAATASGAAVTVSPPVRSSQGDVLSCVAQNLGDQPVAVSAQISNGLNTIVASGALEIAAGRAQVVASTTAAVFGAYCVFTFDASTAVVRGYVQLFDLGGSNTRLLFPAEDTRGRPLANVTTTSPPVRSSEGDVLSCVVQNLSDAPVTVSAAINNGLNTIVDSGSLEVPAGRALALASTTAAVFSAYCTFTFSGSPRQVRGYVQLFDLGGSNTRLLYPARVGSDALLTWQGGVSQPARTWSAPVRSSQGDVLSCVAQNLTNQTVAVTATIHNGLGATVASGMLDVAPGRAQTVTSTTAGVFGAFCEFAFDASILDVRGFIELFDLGGSNTRLLYPAEIVAPTDGPGIPPHRIVSPPVRSSEGDVLNCVAQNLGPAAVDVTTTLHNGLDAVLESATLNIAPERALAVVFTTSAVFGAYCAFEHAGDPALVRGYAQLFDLGGSNTRLLYAAEAVPPPPATATPSPTATPTRVDTATPTPVDTATPTASATVEPTTTATSPVGATATAGATASPTPAQPCVGDCDGDGTVTISELITAVNIALDERPVADCSAADRNRNGDVAIDEIVTAVAAALSGCP